MIKYNMNRYPLEGVESIEYDGGGISSTDASVLLRLLDTLYRMDLLNE